MLSCLLIFSLLRSFGCIITHSLRYIVHTCIYSNTIDFLARIRGSGRASTGATLRLFRKANTLTSIHSFPGVRWHRGAPARSCLLKSVAHVGPPPGSCRTSTRLPTTSASLSGGPPRYPYPPRVPKNAPRHQCLHKGITYDAPIGQGRMRLIAAAVFFAIDSITRAYWSP